MKIPTAFHAVNGVMAAMFLLSAALQYNDPDPAAWVVMYAAAAAACGLYRRPRPLGLAPLLVGVVSLAWALWLAPKTLPDLRPQDLVESMHADTPAIELGREMLGLLIIAGWMGVLLVMARRDWPPEANVRVSNGER